MKKIAVIGLGAMGWGVMKNLLGAGYEVYVNDINEKRMEDSKTLGAVPMSSYKEIGEAAEAVFLFLPMAPFDPTLGEVVLGKGNLLDSMTKGSILIECGNTSPSFDQKIAGYAREKGVLFLDAPASGGPQGAENGTLSVMVGGDLEALEKMSDAFKVISSEVNYFGAAGMGQMAKLANNILVNGGLALLSEVLVFAKKAGLDPVKLIETLEKGAASSWVLKVYGEGIVNRPFKGSKTPGGGFSGKREGGRDKQLAWALEVAEQLETPMPMTSIAYNMFMMARGAGKGGLFEPVVDFLEDLTATEVLKDK